MLHNFGGRTGMYATLPAVASGPANVLASTEFVQGIGMTPEAIETNYITYDLLTTQMWMNTSVDLTSYVPDFATRCVLASICVNAMPYTLRMSWAGLDPVLILIRRYGIANANTSYAWELLTESVFNCIVRSQLNLALVSVIYNLYFSHPSFL